MSGYNYGPPPPPTPAAQASHPSYSHTHHSGPYQQHSRGGGAPPVRGGRGGYQASARPEYPPAAHQAPFDYGRQQPYPQHTTGYQAQHAAGSYPPPPPQQQWHQDHAHSAPQHGTHAPAPLQTSNYHPNYAPQVYSHPQHAHPPAHQPPYGPPQQQQYGHPYQPPAPYGAPQQWAGPDHQAQNQHSAGRGRGGYGNDRGGSRAAVAAPAPVAYGNEGMQHQVNGGYPQPYADPRAQQVQYAPPTQYPYNAPPPAPHAHAHAPAPQREPYHKQEGHSGRGRGNFRGNSGRGRGGFHHNNDRARNRSQGAHHHHRQDGGFQKHDKHDNAASGKKKKRKTNTLGLTPGQESESEDDEMEEEKLRKLIGADALQVTDVAAYIAERKKRFPTAARVKAKKSVDSAPGGSHKFAAALEKEENLASKLRRQLEKVESSIKRKREQQDEGDEMRDSPPIGVKSDNDEPEVASSRVQQAPPPPPAKKADITKHCKYFSTGGTCGKKGKCRFVHDAEVREAAMKDREKNNGQLTIQQRLILNDKDQEDLTVLQSIQYLREKGLMKEDPDVPKANGSHPPGGSKGSHAQARPQTSSLPAAPASLPAPPLKHHNGLPPHNPPPSSLSASSGGHTVRYKGWNLSGFGNTGLKSEDLP
ncbi:hypothetical protein Cob_v005025 [Colletotrichum orbiculare MAFF 240422]|uniref:Uncharacterized protein n=1 Tax=Colletotrichum orbiculare (strain 104-T / ATCC 96160 / CBS 514.97 / LARS 414 / MAFF 240422) TaxID=1213857 RepID=N4VIL7_COLOR|nr:hypothetical protein Cob_v005025 [Colletotrichum orbiculare MAFF 240422]